jgi:hypothetical protein
VVEQVTRWIIQAAVWGGEEGACKPFGPFVHVVRPNRIDAMAGSRYQSTHARLAKRLG